VTPGTVWHAFRIPGRELLEEIAMLSWAVTFLIIALIAGVLGFAGIAGTAAGIAKIIFLIFVIAFLVSLFMGRRTPVP